MKSEVQQPVIIGVAELCEAVPDDLSKAHSLLELLESAALAACQDTGCVDGIISAIDTIAMVRTFADSTPMYPKTLGQVRNYPRAVAGRIGADPARAVYGPAGGNTPQQFVSEYSEKIARGEAETVLLIGGEAIATTKAAMKSKTQLDWSDETGGELEDRGLSLDGMLDRQQMDNGMTSAPLMYGLLENARRHELGKTRKEYAESMGSLFSRFSEIAAGHESAMFKQAYSASELINVDDNNPMIAEPYSKHLVAKDGVNQAAAVILTSREKAEKLGIPQDKMVFPVTGSNVREHRLVERPTLGSSEALRLAYQAVFEKADISPGAVSTMDLYSCFPIAVFSACDAMGMAMEDVRGLTLTGGLSFFGGAGNNYAMHSVVNVVSKLRESSNGYGLVGANGGILSKHSIGLYSRTSPQNGWQACDNRALQTDVDKAELPPVDHNPQGRAIIETYSVSFHRGIPSSGYIIGRTAEGRRFLGCTDSGDCETPLQMLSEDPIGKVIYVTNMGPGNRFTFDKDKTEALVPNRPTSLNGEYKHCVVERNGPVLEVTINRPESRNSLNSIANYELDGVFDLFERTPELWVAIITGAGDKAFCAGNDLKATAAGETMWIPDGGFAGLTHRKGRRKPVIAAVNGMALGGGMEIALACDMVVASEEAVFALPEVKVGLIAGAGGISRLTRQIPRKQAMEFLLLGQSATAEQALDLGFVNSVVPGGDLMSAARDLANRLTEVSPTSTSCILQMLDETDAISDVVEAVRYPAEALDRLLTSEDMQEGVMSFSLKRQPRWKGR